jgi:single-stranded DNA-binding protein
MNQVKLEGAVAGDLVKKEVGGRPVCIFSVSVHDGARNCSYTVPVLAWDALCMYALAELVEGSPVRVEGKLTTRPVVGLPTVLRCEVVAELVGVPIVDPLTIPAPPVDYPAAKPSKARRAAENGTPAAKKVHPVQEELTGKLDLEEVAKAQLSDDALDAAANGVPFELK